jgi:hypothetical protein
MASSERTAARRRISITAGRVSATAILDPTPTADAIWNALPIEGRAHTWGDEIYVPIPVRAELEQGAKDVVEAGDLGYWPPGHAFCIFFGPTPASRGDEIRPASAVNVVGRVQGDPRLFTSVRDGATVTIRRLMP